RRARAGAGPPAQGPDAGASPSGLPGAGERDPEEDATLIMQLVEPGPEGGLFDGRVVEEPRSKVDPERPFDTGKPLIEARPRWRNDPPEPPADDIPGPRDPSEGAEDAAEPGVGPDPHEAGRLFDASALGPDDGGDDTA